MSERVLTDKIKMRPYGEGGIAFSDDGCKCGEGGLVVMDFDGDPFAVEQHASGCDDEEIAARVILALAARVAELELDREGRIRSSDYDKALIEELEAEVAVLSGTACAEEQAEGNGPCGACRTCRNKRITELEAENTKLRKCVAAADATSLQVGRILSGERWEGDFRLVHADGMLDLDGSDRDYRAARAEVDK